MTSPREILGVVWLEEVVDKLHRKHAVLTEEVEEVLFGNPKVRWVEAGRAGGEDLYAAFGRTEQGRLLMILFIYKISREALVVSAREMTAQERKLYARK